MMSSKDVVDDFRSSLCDLTVNSKPHINMLTMLAEDYIAHAPAIVQAIEDHLKHVSSDVKLPVLYLIDSIIKNVGDSYVTLFSQNLVATFTHAFENVDEKARSQMYKLRQTWTVVFPANKLFALDTKVNAIDPAWPITAAPTPGSIHVNPKFLQNPQKLSTLVDKNEELMKQKRELLELQKKKIELELLQIQTKTVQDVRKPAPMRPDVVRIPPAVNIISAPPNIARPSPAAMVAPIRIRDPRLRMKEADKPATPPEPPTSPSPRTVLSPVPSPSNNSQQSSSSETAKPKKDKKKKKESRSPKKSEDSPSKQKDKTDKHSKLTPAEEVLKNLEEEQRLNKIQKLGSDIVIKKAKQHEQKLQPKPKETTKISSLNADEKPPPPKSTNKTGSPLKKVEVLPKQADSPRHIEKSPKHLEQRLPSPKPVDRSRRSADRSPKTVDLFRNVIDNPVKATDRSPKTGDRSPKSTDRSPKQAEVSPKRVEPKAAKHAESKIPDVPVEPKSPKRASPNLVDPQKPSLKSKGKSPEPPPPPMISALPQSPTLLSLSEDRLGTGRIRSPDRTPPPPPRLSSPMSTLSSKDKSTPEDSPRRTRRTRELSKPSDSDSPSPIKIKKPSERVKRNSKRKRDNSMSPEQSPKRKTPTRLKSPPPVTKEPAQPPILEAETLLDSGHDTDLRLLTAKSMELESSPSQKAHPEALDDLFGKEDVDLRALPPPPPIISRPTPPGSPSEHTPNQSPEKTKSKSWANLKRSNSEISPEVSKRHKLERRKSDRFINNADKDEEPSFDDPAYAESVKERTKNIMLHAEEQLSNGNITFAQYNNLLKEVITMDEKRKLEEAMKRDLDAEMEQDGPKSPSPEQESKAGEEKTLSNAASDGGKRRRSRTHERVSRDADGKYEEMKDLQPPPPPEISERDFRDRRYDDRRSRYDHRMPPSGPWMPNQMPGIRPGMRNPRDKYGRWPPMMGPGRPGSNYGPRFGHPMNFPVPPGFRELPPADPGVLEMIAKDPMKTIDIDGVPREIRYYGETAVTFMNWDDPRELLFQPDTRRVTFNDRETFLLNFNAPYKEICVDGFLCKVRLGAPTRELYIDGVFYEGIFGGPPIQVLIGNNRHSVRLHGPRPQVRIGDKPRKDLVAGKVNLIVDATHIYQIYLDAKPQRINIGGIPYILRFVEALQTVVINGIPSKVEFGSDLPVPMYFHGEKHYLRFSDLPKGVRPGYITIVNMEGGRLPSPPPMLPPPLPMMVPDEAIAPAEIVDRPPRPSQMETPSVTRPPERPLELLASLLPSFTPGIGQSYSVEDTQPDAKQQTADIGPINVGELLKKLQAVGIVPSLEKKEEKKEDISTEIIPVSFDNPETLRTRQSGLIHLLYSGMQCSSCGVRFPPEQTGKYSQHLDWHFRQNRRERDAMRVAQSRRWNYDVSDWIQFKEIEEKEERAQSWFEIQEKRNFETEESTEDDQSVPAGDKGENASCELCQDKFDAFYNEEKEEWHLKRAMEVDGKLYHPLCYKEKEEKLSAPPPPLPMLLPSTGEPELIEIPDDVTTGDEPVLTMPVDEEKLECIDLDSEPSNSKDGPDEEEKPDHDSDDDILGVEVLEQKIETYDLIDEDDEVRAVPDDDDEQTIELEMPKTEEPPSEEDLEVDLSKVKSEKVEVVDLDAQTSQPTVVSSIDGNVELEDAAPVSLPKRIVINIPSAVTRPPAPVEDRVVEEPAVVDESSNPPSAGQSVDPSEPPPPGEELYPQSVKPRVAEAELKILQTVNKGSELSALCSIM